MPRFWANYTTSYMLDVPKNVFLLTKEEVEKNKTNRPGHWWVKWGTFHYIDKNGEEQEIEGEEWSEHKWPESVEKLEDEDEDEDEEAEEIENPFEEDEEDDGGSFVSEEPEEKEESMKARGAMDGDGFVVCEHCGKGGGAHASDDCPDYEFVVCSDKGCEGHWIKKASYDHLKAGVKIYA